MQIYSKTHTIQANARTALVPAKGPDGKKLSETTVVNHPAGTILDMKDDDAQDLINRGFATEYKREDFDKDPVDGVVPTHQPVANVAPLPDGQTRPSMKREDGSLNETPPGANVTGTVEIVRDTKDDAARQKKADDELEAQRAAATKGGQPFVAPPGGGDPSTTKSTLASTAANPPKTVDQV